MSQNNLTVRLVRPEDAPDLAGIYRPYVEETTVSFEETAPDEAEFLRRIGQVTAQYPWVVCEAGGQVVGYAYASSFRSRRAYRWDTEGSIYLDRGFRGSGIGRTLYQCLIELLALQGYRNLYSCITVPNERSISMHRALGFTEVGRFPQSGYKFGRWLEIAWLWKALGSRSGPPEEPRPLDQLDPAEVEQVLKRWEQQLE